MSRKLRFICGILCGFFVGSILSIILTNNLPFVFSEYLPVFLGSFVSFFVTKEKPIISGCIVALMLMLFSVASFFLIIRTTNSLSPGIDLKEGMLISWLAYLPFGIFGSSLANVIAHRIQSVQR